LEEEKKQKVGWKMRRELARRKTCKTCRVDERGNQQTEGAAPKPQERTDEAKCCRLTRGYKAASDIPEGWGRVVD